MQGSLTTLGKGEIAMGTEYKCSQCANRATPICRDCSRISAPSGKDIRPKHFIYLDEPLRMGDILGANAKEGDMESLLMRAEALTDEDLLSVIANCLIDGNTIPLAAVIYYNRKIEAQRQRNTGNKR